MFQVILLIYEYAIAVESSIVQRKRSKSNESSDNPVADRLDRSYFGFDQDYFERMPLLVNAMQESTHVETSETAPLKHRARYLISNFTNTKPAATMSYKTSPIRRTSPRPFIFEYKSPTPTPFSQTYGSRSWVENYRNAQRLKNLQQVIKYLEKTINAKFGDMYTLPTTTHIAFSGVYVEPVTDGKNQAKTTSPTIDLLLQSSNKAETFKTNHQSDPLFSFKPESPGDVNLLADGFWRFSPIATPSNIRGKLSTNVPMFRPIGNSKKNCIGMKCQDNNQNIDLLEKGSEEHKSTELPSLNTPKSFSVMLNLFPMNPSNMDYKGFDTLDATSLAASKIRITTSRPTKIHFRRRSTTPVRRTSTIFKRPRIISDKRMHKNINFDNWRLKQKAEEESKMIVHVNVYPTVEAKKEQSSTENNIQTITHRYTTEMPMLTSTQVEDYHLGSSGIINIESRFTPAPAPPISTSPLPITTQFYDTVASSSEINIWPTNPPDVVKFSAEDAKVPDHYTSTSPSTSIVEYENISQVSDEPVQPKINRRNSQDSFHMKDEDEDLSVDTRTLIIKLKNEIETNTKFNKKITTTEAATESKGDDETTTTRTYVPQINGHYRSVNQNSKNINSWLNPYSRNRRLEMSVTGFRKQTYVPQYVEIKRNNTRNTSDEDI